MKLDATRAEIIRSLFEVDNLEALQKMAEKQLEAHTVHL